MEYLKDNVDEAISAFNAIEEKIVETGVEVEEGTRPRMLANKIPQVYEAGKKAEYDKMWDVLQPEGVTYYSRKFTGSSFNFDNFYPKRDIRPVGDATQIFYAWENGNCKGDFKARLEECDVVLDTSKATKLDDAFSYSHMDNLPVIDCTGLTVECSGLFANSWGDMKTIEKIILKDTVKCINWFNNATGLENVIFEGTIGQKGVDIHWSTKLNAKSLFSIIKALSQTTTGLTITLPITAEANYNANPPEGAPATWLELVGDGTEEHLGIRPNWTIAYA